MLHQLKVHCCIFLLGLPCTGGQSYRSCIMSCTYSCSALAADPTCEDSECVEGCACPEGQALTDEGVCVSLEACPCLFDGNVFEAGKGYMMADDYW